jgi:hypothetical protein
VALLTVLYRIDQEKQKQLIIPSSIPNTLWTKILF